MALLGVPGVGVKSYIDPADYGAEGNARTTLAATVAAGSLDRMTAADSSPFTAGDVGKVIAIPYAGAIDAGKTIAKTHVTTISSYISSSVVGLATPALNPISAATHPAAAGYAFAVWGADDATPLNNAMAAASAARKPLRLLLNKLLLTAQITWPDYCTMIGEGRYASVLYPVGFTHAAFRYDGSADGAPPLLAPVIRDLELDGRGLANSTYHTGTKGFFFQHFREMLLENAYVHHTPATAVGCDHPIDSEWINAWAEYGGRQVDELGGSFGGSGLGIGCGKNEYESLLVSGGGAKNCGKYGLFIENQTTSNPLPKGYRVDGFVADSCKTGVSLNGTQGAIVSNSQAFRCTVAGFAETKAFTDRYGRDTLFTGCVSMYNVVGAHFDTRDGYVKWHGGEIAFNTSDGFQLEDTNSTPGHPTHIRIQDADIFQNAGRGVRFLQGAFGRIAAERCKLWNNGASTTTRRAAIDCIPTGAKTVTIDRLDVTGNRAWDDRAGGSKTQSYGLDTTGATVALLVRGGNDFSGNADGKVLLPAGTVTAETTVLGGDV